MDQITPTKIRYIKLGPKGSREGALDRGRLEWGGSADLHVAAPAGDWEGVAAGYADQDRIASTVTGYTNEARAFFDGDTTVMWITFARGRMWWAFADSEVHLGSEGSEDAGRTTVKHWVAGVTKTSPALSWPLSA